jgi:biopolymer transport protein ExbD
MMDFSQTRPRRRPAENIVPMINVVFLLLIFFLMSAQFLPPDPAEIALPQSVTNGEAALSDTLYIAADGTLYYDGAEGEQALARLTGRGQDRPLYIRADADLAADVFANLLPKLSAAGVRDTLLVTRGP